MRWVLIEDKIRVWNVNSIYKLSHHQETRKNDLSASTKVTTTSTPCQNDFLSNKILRSREIVDSKNGSIKKVGRTTANFFIWHMQTNSFNIIKSPKLRVTGYIKLYPRNVIVKRHLMMVHSVIHQCNLWHRIYFMNLVYSTSGNDILHALVTVTNIRKPSTSSSAFITHIGLNKTNLKWLIDPNEYIDDEVIDVFMGLLDKQQMDSNSLQDKNIFFSTL